MNTHPLSKFTQDDVHRMFAVLPGDDHAIQEKRRRFLGMIFEGKPIRDWNLEMKTTHPGDIRYEKSYGEALAAAGLFVGAGLDEQVASIRRQAVPHTDIAADMKDGSVINIEMARVVDEDSAEHFGVLSQLLGRAHELQRSDSRVAAACREKLVMFMFPMLPNHHIDPVAALSEMEAVVLDTTFITSVEKTKSIRRVPSAFGYLDSCQAKLSVFPVSAQAGLLDVQSDGGAFDPGASIVDIRRMLDEKAGKTYADPNPWLGLYLADVIQPEFMTMEHLRDGAHAFNIGPFSRVIIGTTLDAITIP